MPKYDSWSFKNRLRSAVGLVILGAALGALTWGLGRGAAAAAEDQQSAEARFQAGPGPKSPSTFEVLRRTSPGAADARQARTFMRANGMLTIATVLTGSLAAACFAGAAAIFFVRSPSGKN